MTQEFFVHWRGVTVIQYWNSFDKLERYAREGATHLSAWRQFNRSIGTDGTVGIYHETYVIHANECETLYNIMPKYGLGAVGEHVPAVGRRETARRRMGGENNPAVPTPDNPEIANSPVQSDSPEH